MALHDDDDAPLMVISIDMGHLLGGTSSHGEFEERLRKIIDEVRSCGDIILFIDEVHKLIGTGAGADGNSALDAANLMKPPLARGATTVSEYKKHIEKDSALERRFQPILEHHNVRYEDNAVVAAVRLSDRYIRDRFLPDKALDLIDEAGSHARINASSANEDVVVKEIDVQHVVSCWTGIPIRKLSTKESGRLLRMEGSLDEHIIGQEAAVSAISRAIRRSRTGVKDPRHPIESLLFVGPTGVGKAEVANVLAAEYFGSKAAMVRLDMSEFYGRHTVSKLVGEPPGYVETAHCSSL
ncbi:hypothetical protein Syun_024604 [Stephania yunnanensis]|uniref:Uncharacterized protein n=1 Tax=Stephania yunnanensis TaxID=152371 RepID=A0AAP0NII6_9MAGN